MRKVIYSGNIQVPTDNIRGYNWEYRELGEALFHQFGVAYEEFDSGPAPYTTAIIELEGGIVKSIPVENIRFLGEA